MEVTIMKDENIRKLREMRLPAFANAYIAQRNNLTNSQR